MMKLNFTLLDLPINLEMFTIFAIEDVKVFANIARLLYQYDETSDLKIFDEQNNNLKDSEIMLISDVLGYDINSPTVLKLIYADLEQQLNEKPEVKSMIDKLTSTISELIGYELVEHELDLEGDEITILELFKSLGIRVETQSDTIYEKIFEIIQVFKYLSKKKILIFVNICSYFNSEQLEGLKEYILLSNVRVLFIEPREILNFPQYLLDSDFYLHKKV